MLFLGRPLVLPFPCHKSANICQIGSYKDKVSNYKLKPEIRNCLKAKIIESRAHPQQPTATQTPWGVLRLRTYGDVPLENLKATMSRSQIPENHTLSRSKIYLNNTLPFSFFGQSCAQQGNLYEIYRKLWKYCHPSDLNHIRRVQMA